MVETGWALSTEWMPMSMAFVSGPAGGRLYVATASSIHGSFGSPLPTGLSILTQVSKNLIVSSVLLDDVNHMLDPALGPAGKAIFSRAAFIRLDSSTTSVHCARFFSIRSQSAWPMTHRAASQYTW